MISPAAISGGCESPWEKLGSASFRVMPAGAPRRRKNKLHGFCVGFPVIPADYREKIPKDLTFYPIGRIMAYDNRKLYPKTAKR